MYCSFNLIYCFLWIFWVTILFREKNHNLLHRIPSWFESVWGLKRKVHLRSFWWSSPIASLLRRIKLFCSSSPIWWFTFAGVFNWAAIDNLIISQGTGNSIRLQAGKWLSRPARCRVISAIAPFLSLTINPEMEARLPFPPHSTLLHSCVTIEQFFAFCDGSGLQEEWWSTQTLIQISP